MTRLIRYFFPSSVKITGYKWSNFFLPCLLICKFLVLNIDFITKGKTVIKHRYYSIIIPLEVKQRKYMCGC